MNKPATVVIAPGKDRSLRRGHPWLYAGSIVRGGGDTGATVRVVDGDGRFLGWGAFSPRSALRVRIWSFDEAEAIDEAFFARRVGQAVATRSRLAIESDAMRLVHGEADGLPGFIADRYADTLVVQCLSAGAERWRDVLVDALMAATGLARVHERSDASHRALEGLAVRTGWLRGDGPTQVEIREHGWRMALDVAEGHKTGWYLDQRDNRLAFAQAVQRLGCRRVLNCFSYTGGFSVAARHGGARQVVSVDSSGPALVRARDNLARNGFETPDADFLDADVNATLRQAIARGDAFDAIVLDPPKFAPSAQHAERAARAYKDINRLALRLLAPGGLLMTFSCSGGIGPELFQKIVAGAGTDAGVEALIIQRLGAAPDHPASLRFPEGEYLKGLALLRQ